jgi:Ca2+-binding EF-hand superfamily protein
VLALGWQAVACEGACDDSASEVASAAGDEAASDKQDQRTERATARFAELDLDGDDTVSLEEWRAATEKRFKPPHPAAASSPEPEAAPEPAEGAAPLTEADAVDPLKQRWLARAEKRFKRIDANGDGSLDQEEFVKGFGRRGERRERPSRLSRLDKDGDKRVSFDEYRALRQRRPSAFNRPGRPEPSPEELEKRQRERFERLDADRDGFLSEQELGNRRMDKRRAFGGR